ncbi:Non-specific lipid transfer protein GPI-anchored 25 [Linum grandiflorum]
MSVVFPLIFTAVLFLTAAASQPLPPRADCVADLAAFSPCFAYVSVRPNRVRHRVNRQCCRVVSEAFNSGGSNCFCHLVKQPLLSGFPLNRTRIASLPSLCSHHWYKNASSSMKNFGSMKSICTAVPPSAPSSKGSLGVPTSPHPGPQSVDHKSDIMEPPTESPSVSVPPPHNQTQTLAPMSPPAASGKPSSASSSTNPRRLPHHPHPLSAPTSSVAAELGFTRTWILHVAAAVFSLAFSLVQW